MTDSFKGYSLGVIAAASYGTNPLFALPMLNAGVDAFSVLFLRYFFAIPMLAIMMATRKRGFGLHKGQILPLAIMGVLIAMSSLTLYVSYAYIGAAIASTLLFIYPILVTMIMAVVFNEKISVMTILCIVLATTGIGLLYRGDDGAILDPYGLLLVFLSALSYAIYLVAVNKGPMKEIPTLKLTFYVIVFGLFLFAFRFQMSTFTILSDHPWLWISAFCMAFFPTAVSLICTSSAIQKVGSTPVAILGAVEPVTAVAIAILVFNELLTLRLAIGMLLVIVSVTLIIAAGKS